MFAVFMGVDMHTHLLCMMHQIVFGVGSRENKTQSDLPAYRRIDLRLMKDFSIFGASASAYLDVNNLFNWKNIQAYRYSVDSNGNPYQEEVTLWPIIPTFGVSVRF